jgi:hypothetical protein
LLDAALAQYTERIQREDKQVGFAQRLATADSEELFQINSEISALNTALSASPEVQKTFFSDVTNRRNAFAGLEALNMFGFEDKGLDQIKAKAQLSVFKNTPEFEDILNMKNAEGLTTRQILERRANGEPTEEEENARKALDLQQEANDALTELDRDLASKMKDNITEPLKMLVQLRQLLGEKLLVMLRPAESAGPADQEQQQQAV